MPPAYGGAEVAAMNYARRLQLDPDSDVMVIGWDRTGAYGENHNKYDFIHSVRFNENPQDAKGIFVYFQQYYHIWQCFWALVRPMWKYRRNYDYVHNFNSGFAFNRVSIFIAKIFGKKVITETSLVGDDDPLSLGRFNDWKDYLKPKFVRYLFYRMADKYVSKSVVITEIFRRSKIPMDKVAEIPYSVDIWKFKPIGDKEKKELRNKLNLWEDGMIILFVGGINIRKGVHILTDAFISIAEKYPQIKLLIVGPTYKYDQQYIAEIKEKIKISHLEERIHLTEENVNNVEEYMQAADIFILPSKQEGFPISIIEAMSSSLGVIGSDIPEISKAQIIDGEDGFVFPAGNREMLATVIELVINDVNLDCVRARARKKVVANWSTEIVDNAYKKLYESI